MQNYTTMQRMKVVEFYYQSQQSIIQARHKYRKYFNSRLVPSISMTRYLVGDFVNKVLYVICRVQEDHIRP